MNWFRSKSKRADAAVGARPVILLIDDEVDLCHILHLVLTQAGYNVEMAHDGEEGWP